MSEHDFFLRLKKCYVEDITFFDFIKEMSLNKTIKANVEMGEIIQVLTYYI